MSPRIFGEARYRKLPQVEEELRRTRRRLMQMFGQEIPALVKEAHADLYTRPVTGRPQDDDETSGKAKPKRGAAQGRRKHSMVESDPTFEAVANQDRTHRRRDFDRAMWMLTHGLIKHVEEALALLAPESGDQRGPEEDIYKLEGRAAPTVGSYTERQHRKKVTELEQRRQHLEQQGPWKYADIE